MPHSPSVRRPKSALRLLIGWVLGVVAVSFIAGVIAGFTGEGVVSDGLFYALIVVLTASAIWISALYWRRLDEAAREAHKFAWYWGGSAALAVSGVGIVILMKLGVAFLLPGLGAGPGAYLATGALTVLLAQVIGYGLVWAGWWLWNSRS